MMQEKMILINRYIAGLVHCLFFIKINLCIQN